MFTRFQVLRWRALSKLVSSLPDGKQLTYEERSWYSSANLMMRGKQPGDKVRVWRTW